MTHSVSEQALRREIALNSDAFSAWEDAGSEDHFGPGEMIAALVAFCAALKAINDALDTAEAVVKRAISLHNWVRDRIEPAGTPLTPRERVLAALVNIQFDGGTGILTDHLAKDLALGSEECATALASLSALGHARETESGWVYRRG